jgi:hypothetical protein
MQAATGTLRGEAGTDPVRGIEIGWDGMVYPAQSLRMIQCNIAAESSLGTACILRNLIKRRPEFLLSKHTLSVAD